jgi:hypothetical protein
VWYHLNRRSNNLARTALQRTSEAKVRLSLEGTEALWLSVGALQPTQVLSLSGAQPATDLHQPTIAW